MDDKIEAFAECLLGDIFDCFTEALGVNVEYSKEEEEKRFAPPDFFCEIISLSKIFMDELMPDLARMPVLLCYCEDFFRRFTNSVCLKLINNEDPEVGFLKVISFLTVVTSLSFINSCYRSIDDIPTILIKLLKGHIKTRFYVENRFDEIASLCRELKENEKWYASTIEEMRAYMNESLETELEATRPQSSFQPDRTKIKILDVKSHEELNTDETLCPYCWAKCIFFLNAFWKPKIVYKPECHYM